jgi:hypothetical protein
MKLFPDQPEVSREDTQRILPHVKNRNVIRKWIRTSPSVDDLKRAVLIEVFRSINSNKSPLSAIGRGVCIDLIVAIQRVERSAINDAIMDVLVSHEPKKKK